MGPQSAGLPTSLQPQGVLRAHSFPGGPSSPLCSNGAPTTPHQELSDNPLKRMEQMTMMNEPMFVPSPVGID